MKNDTASSLGVLIVITLAAAGLYGWIANIISLIAGNEPLGKLIARAIGILAAPLGAVLGYF